MADLKPVRGTHDLLPDKMRQHRAVIDTARRIVRLYGFEEIATPIFEFTEVFQRTLGDTSDVVTKEMYSFEDRNGDLLTLRPENTAGVARCFISEGLAHQTPLKFFYSGPMFRRERPQRGRLRQFHQIGVELIGVGSPGADVDAIAAAYRTLDALGILSKIKLELNSLGDLESRNAYRAALINYFTPHKKNLSHDGRMRLEHNPLRILDSKDEADRELVAEAPVLSDYLTENSRNFFLSVQEGLVQLGIDFEVNRRLVRGLDYYGQTTFEFVTKNLGAQGTVLAGGRYDSLIEQMGGPSTPGVGWAAGIERLVMLIDNPLEDSPIFAIVPIGQAAVEKAKMLAEQIRDEGLVVDLAYAGNISRRMKRANRIGASASLIFGDEELERNVVQLRDMKTGEQSEISLKAVVAELTHYCKKDVD